MNLQNPNDISSKLIAGEICLNFINTVDWRAGSNPEDRLKTYADLIGWSRTAGLVDQTVAKSLLRKAHGKPRAAAAVMKRARSLREVIYGIIMSTLQEQAPNDSDLETFNGALTSAQRHQRVASHGGRLQWSWKEPDQKLDAVLWPILRSAADLLTSDARKRIGQCEDDRGCGWLFLDKTKNHSRRWCSMRDCGNRAKARRHYQRSHTITPASRPGPKRTTARQEGGTSR